MDRERGVLAPGWYAAAIGPPVQPIEELLERLPRPLRDLTKRSAFARGTFVFIASRGFGTVAFVHKDPGTMTAVVLEAIMRPRRRRVVLLQFLPRPLPRSRWRRAAYRGWLAAVERPALRRALRAAHVLTEREREDYARSYALPLDRFRHIPWAFARDSVEPPPFSPTASREVIASGRASCDWETLFAAAEGGSWPLTVICGEADRERVAALNQGGRAEVLCEIPRHAHDARLRHAAVYVLCLVPDGASAGHVRLMAAHGAGVPVIASRVSGLDGYVDPGTTALLVPPGDEQALRDAIDELLAAPAKREQLRTAAFERARGWTYREHFGAIRSLLLEGQAE